MRIVVILCLVGLMPQGLGGCTLQSLVSEEIETPIRDTRKTFEQALEQAPAEAVRVLPHTPWGENRSIKLHQAYTAASGRWCRRLTIEPEADARPALVCRSGDDQGPWELVRLLHIAGRPMLETNGMQASLSWNTMP